MPFMQRLQSALILKTSMHHAYESNIIEHPEKKIYKAIEQNNSTQVQEKIFAGYDIDLKSAHQLPVLIYAVIYDRVECVTLLLQNGANVNITDKNERTPLHFAINLCLYELIYLLLRYGANPHLQDDKGLSPIDYAKSYKDAKSIKILEEITQIFVQKGDLKNFAKDGKLYELVNNLTTPLDIFKADASGITLLHIASRSGNLKLINYLCNKGISIDALDSHYNTPLLYALINQAPLHVIEFLVQKGASIDVKNRYKESPLLVAIKNGNYEAANFLINKGANVNVTEGINTSLTLCHFAIHSFVDKAAKLRTTQTKLIAKGATVDIPINKLQWTPLMHCCAQKEYKLIKDHFEILIQLGANPNQKDINGRTPLMLAASVGNIYFLQRVMENYASIDSIDNYGWNALIFAVYYSHQAVVKELLEQGADVNTVTNNGQTALLIATTLKNNSIISLLKDFGAYVNKE